MKVDLVERLREAATKPNGWAILGAPAATEAADALERLTAENAALRKDAERLRNELRIIATAKPSEWDADMRDQFQPWAQNRARAAMEQSHAE